MENNCNLFVCAHKDFGCKLVNDNYTILCGKNDEVNADAAVDYGKYLQKNQMVATAMNLGV